MAIKVYRVIKLFIYYYKVVYEYKEIVYFQK